MSALYVDVLAHVEPSRLKGRYALLDNIALFAGAVYSLEDDIVALEGNMSFVDNFSGIGGGAMSLGDPGELTIVGVNFTRNKANVGGAVSVTAVQNREREYIACRFENNKATADGGAIYFVTGGGSDNVTSSVFRGNFAGEITERRLSVRYMGNGETRVIPLRCSSKQEGREGMYSCPAWPWSYCYRPSYTDMDLVVWLSAVVSPQCKDGTRLVFTDRADIALTKYEGGG